MYVLHAKAVNGGKLKAVWQLAKKKRKVLSFEVFMGKHEVNILEGKPLLQN